MHADLAAQLSPAVLKLLGGKDLEYDTEKLEELAAIVVEEQEAVVRAHVGIGLPWKDALLGKTPRSSAPPAPETASPSPPIGRRIERRKVCELKPNRFNAGLFPDSLNESSIAQIADDLTRNGQRVPVEITPDDEITDGERRWRGAQQLGWDEMDVVVGPALSDDEMLDRVVDACTSSRQMSLREQTNVYAAVCERLKRDAGRPVGRPDQIMPKDIIYLTPRSIKDAAAKRAGFSSTTLAVRAQSVFSRGSEELQAKVREGLLSITAAYDDLPKRSKSKAMPEEMAPRDERSNADFEATDHGDQTDEAAETGAAEPEPATLPDDDEPRHDDEGASVSANPIEDTDSPGDEAAEPTDDEGDELEEAQEPDDSEPALTRPGDDEPNVGVHVGAVCRHIASLAERDYEDAVSWFDQVVDEMRASLGEPPEFDDDEALDE